MKLYEPVLVLLLPMQEVETRLATQGSEFDGTNWNCPAHDDKNPSLSVKEWPDHHVSVHCFAGCETDEVLDALDLVPEDLDAPQPSWKTTAIHVYQRADGTPLTRKIRKEDQRGLKGKRFVTQHHDGRKWVNGGSKDKLLYCVCEVRRVAAAGGTVVVMEGEKAADAFNTHERRPPKMVATTAIDGASGEWLGSYTADLKGAAKIILWPDRDSSGKGYGYMLRVYRQLKAAGFKVFFRQSATTGDKDDAYDHFQAGYAWGDAEKPKLGEVKRLAGAEAELSGRQTTAPDGDDKKRTAAERLMDIAEQAYHFTRSPNNLLYAVPTDGANLARPISNKGRGALGDELADRYWMRWGKVAGTTALNDALSVLRGKAMGLDPEQVALRVAQPDAATVVVDLGDESGRAVVVTSGGWEVAERSPVLFSRTELTAAFPTPIPGGDLATLRAMLHVDDETFDYLVAWLVAAFIPDIPHAALMINGEFGTAKSYTSKLLGQLIDPASVQLRRAPTKAEEWPASVAGSWCVVLDNLSHIPDWLSDALCRAVTSEGSVKRTLYTDADIHVESFRRVLILNGIEVGGVRDDLADRLSVVDLLPIPPGARREEAALTAEFAAAWPELFGALLDVLSDVLKVREDGRDRLEVLPRLADFARVLRAVDVVRDTGALPTYLERAETAARELAEEDPVSEAVVSLMLAGQAATWEGRAAELLVALEPPVPVPTGWPKNARTLASRLKRLSPGLRAAGWTVEQRRSNGDKLWFIEPARVGAGS